jgi:hypothetical protein
MELTDIKGAVVARTVSGSVDPHFSFSVLTPGTYFVRPVVGRTQQATPGQTAVALPTSNPALVFQIRGNPTTVQVPPSQLTLPSGTFVLLTATPYTSNALPNATPPNSYSGTAGSDGSVQISVAPGAAYYIQCWKPVTANGSTTFTKTGAGVHINGGNALTTSNNTYQAPCPGSGG